ncbi:ABC transporter permease [Nonomuraea basaltis]|uniref:ABC transporter permease n=1 Tax=Nonomuraea basaltis TaxID=2495887 RepID=UPI00197D492B|nr:ABC transporter permease [Nonomuraea basaltis]
MRWSWFASHVDEMAELTLQHVITTVISVGCGLLIALPLAVLAHRIPRLRGLILGITSVIFTVPSIALFILLLPFTGLSLTTTVIGLTLYSLVVLVRNIVEGLASVPPRVREAARAMGYGRARALIAVELPLALPVIMAGVRIATIMTISLTSVALVIGQGALGQLFADGLQRNFAEPIIAGIALTLLLAMVADVALVGVQRGLTPWTRR